MIINNKNVKACLDFAGKNLYAPEQRWILGATALATQPVIDLKNKNVDEDTRMMSVARTMAKIVAGTLVGVGVRYAGIKFIKHFSKYETILNENKDLVLGVYGKKGRDFFVPLFAGKNKLQAISPEKLEKKFNLYTKALGTFVATVAMIFTNFVLDAPLTKWLTGIFHKKITSQNEAVPMKKEGVEK